MSRVVGALLMVAILASSARADVIPSQYPDRDADKGRTVVAQRLQGMGITADQAAGRVRDLTDDEAKFFAANPERVQRVGEEQVVAAWIQGVVALAAVIGISGYFYTRNN